MKHFLSLVFSVFISLNIFATVHTVTSPFFTFAPDSLVIVQGDTVNWAIGPNHDVVEVDSIIWAANGNTSNGGFSLPLGGGTHVFNTVGTFYYVCSPHASSGMKGLITVTAPPPATVNITFMVNTANITVDPAGIFVSGGGIFGNPGDNPLTDANGDGIWEGTFSQPHGISGNYIFLNGNCPSYSCKENIAGLPCSDAANFNDRILPTISSDTTIMTCFESCATDTVCPIPPATIDIDFTLDLSQYGSSYTTAYIFGSFNGWNTTTNPLVDQGNDIWTGSITVNENDSFEYKFLADASAENMTLGSACTKTAFGFTNRFVSFGSSNLSIDTVCWQSCSTCPPISPLAQMDLPVSFDDTATINYNAIDFDGAITTLASVDPIGGVNLVACTKKPASAQPWAGSILATPGTPDQGFENDIPFAANAMEMTLDVYSPSAGLTVMLKVEDENNGGTFAEAQAVTASAGAWETLTFDFGAPTGGSINLANSYNKSIVFFNFLNNTPAAADTLFYWDNLMMAPPAPLAQMDLPVTFDDTSSVEYNAIDFDGAITTLASVDPIGGVNLVACTKKPASAQPWAGSILATPGTPDQGFENDIPFAANAMEMTLDVYSPSAGLTVMLKVEDENNGGTFAEAQATTTSAGTWETLTFDFATPTGGSINLANSYNKSIVFFNFLNNTPAVGDTLFYWDNLMMVPPPPLAQMDLPIIFDDFATVDYNAIDFDGAITTLQSADPIGGTNIVACTKKPASAQPWAGSILATPGTPDQGFANDIPFAANAMEMTLDVYSPSAGLTVMLKVEDENNAGTFAEAQAITTSAGAWETLTFDFAAATGGSINLTNSYNKAIVFFNFLNNTPAAADTLFYWDNLMMWAPAPLAQMDLPVSFDDTATINYNAIDFDGAITTLASVDPIGGVNLVACTKKPASAQPWAGSILATPGTPDQGFENDIPFAANAMEMTLDVYSPSAGLTVMLKVEDENNGGTFAEAQAITASAGAWETLTFDFATPTGGSINLANSYNKSIVFFNFLNNTPAAADTLFYWDNLMMAPPAPLAQMDLPVTFDDTSSVEYNAIDFDGAITTLASVDPIGGVNLVACTKKPASAQPWAGSILATPGTPDQGFENDIPFAANAMEMTLDVYSPSAGLTVMLKVEDENNGGTFAEAQATTTSAGTWETLTFDFATPTGGSINLANSYNKSIVFFNFLNNTPAVGDTLFYWDNLMMVPPPPLAQMDLPIIFDDFATVDYNAIDFDGAITTLQSADPIGGTNIVACTKKPASAQPWAGSILATPGTPDQGFANDIPFAANAMEMTLDVYSPSAGLTVMLKVEDENNAGTFAEAQAITTSAGAWETLTFDFAAATGGSINLANSYNKAIVFFNFLNNTPAAADTLFYWDNLMMWAPAPLAQMDLPVSFDDTATINYNAIDFDGAITTLASVDPIGGVNLVACTKKPASAQPWAGSILATPGTPDQGFENDIPFTASVMQMSLDVYSPSAGLTVMLKVEDENNGGTFAEAQAITASAGAWETLTFDFATPTGGSINLANSYNKAIVFFNFLNNTPAVGDTIFYWDNLMMLPPAPLAQMDLPVTFDDTATVEYNAIDFDGAITTLASVDPIGGVNLVACTKKPASAQPWAGSILATPGTPDQGFENDIPFATGLMEMTLDVYSPSAGLTVMLKVEDENNGGTFAEAQATTTSAGAWETLTFDFSAPSGGSINLANSYNKAIVFFNFLNNTPAVGDTIFYWDNLMMAPLTQMDMPVTFDDPTVDYETVDFSGTSSMFTTDPTNPSNMVVQTTKNGGQIWAGTTLATPGTPNELGFSSAIPFTTCNTQMTVRVYSPTAGIPVRLKVEDQTNGGISVETETMTTMANSWEVMNFDFSNPVAVTPALNLANTYDKATIFFDFGTVGTGQVYYWDDIQFVTGYTWNGSVSTDWSVGANWDEGTAPSACADVTIPDVSSASGNDPIITPMVTLGDVTVAANASIEINEGIVLDGTFTNNGTVTLKSTATSTAYLDDFTNAGASYVGEITVERYVTPGSGLGQRLFGSAVNSSSISGLDMTYASGYPTGAYITPDVCGISLMPSSAYSNLLQYEQANVPSGGCDQLGWFAMNPSATLTPGRGYSGWMNDGSVISVTGTPNTGNVDFITSGSSGSGVATADGWHLLSNPYPSPLDVEAYISSGFTSPVTYNGGSGSYYGTFNPVLLSGSELAIMQGFYAENTGASTTATVTNSERIASSASTWFSTSSLLSQMLTINVIGNGFADKTNIFYKDHSLVTNDFDDYTDCKKRSSNIGQPTIYSSLNNDRMALNGFPTSELGNSVPFGVAHGADGNFELTFEGMSDFPVNTTIYIEDKHLGVYHNIANGNYAYSALASDNSDRFELHFVLAVEIATVNVNCNGDNGKIQLLSTEGIANRDFIISELNTLIASGSLNTLDVEVQEGIYTVTVNDAFGGSQTYDIVVESMDRIESNFTLSETEIKVGDLIVLENETFNATTINWEMNGELISEASYLNYSFAEEGIYDISLQVANDDCQDVKTEKVSVSSKTTSILDLSNGQSVSINSVSNTVIIDFINLTEENANLNVFNLLGKNVFSKTMDTDTRQSISLDKLSSGYYLIQLNVLGETLTAKMLVKSKN